MTQPQDVSAVGPTRTLRWRLALFLLPLLGAAAVVAAAVVAALGVQSWHRGPDEVASAPPPPTPTSAPPAPAPAPQQAPKWSKFRPRAAVLRTTFDSPPTGTDLDRPEGFVVPLTGWPEKPHLWDAWRGSVPIKGAACKYVHVGVRFMPPASWWINVGGSDSPRWPFVVGGEGRDGFQGGQGKVLQVRPDGVPGPGGVWFGGEFHSLSAALIGLTAGPRPTSFLEDKSPRVEVSLVE